MWQVLQALQDNGLVILVEKYVWGVPELDYLDHQISTAAAATALPCESHPGISSPFHCEGAPVLPGWSTFTGGFYLECYLPSALSRMSYMAAGRSRSTWRGIQPWTRICCCQVGLAGGHPHFPSCGRSDSQPVSGCFSHARGSVPATAASRVLLCYSDIYNFRHMLEGHRFAIYTNHNPLTDAPVCVWDWWTARQCSQLSPTRPDLPRTSGT